MRVKILSITDRAGQPRTDGEYPELIGRTGDVLANEVRGKLVIQLDTLPGQMIPKTYRIGPVRAIIDNDDTITVKMTESVYLLEVI